MSTGRTPIPTEVGRESAPNVRIKNRRTRCDPTYPDSFPFLVIYSPIVWVSAKEIPRSTNATCASGVLHDNSLGSFLLDQHVSFNHLYAPATHSEPIFYRPHQDWGWFKTDVWGYCANYSTSPPHNPIISRDGWLLLDGAGLFARSAI